MTQIRDKCSKHLHLRCTQGENGNLFVTPEFSFFEEIVEQINILQDELDELRERARCAFQVPF